MSIRLATSTAAALLFGLAVAGQAHAQAQAGVQKECSVQYQAAKAGNSLNGQSWQDFYKACRANILAAPAAAAPAAAPAAPAPAPAAAAPPPAPAAAAPPPPPPAPVAAPAPTAPAAPAAAAGKKPPSAGQAAARDRQKQCGVEWKAKKDEIRKTNPTAKWPQFWSECNKRLKGEAQ